MGIIGIVAIMATFLMLPLGMDRRNPPPLLVLLTIPLVQIGGLFMALAFIAARPFDTDTITYFYDVLGVLSDGVKPGTSFIVYLTTWLTELTSGSFDDLMALYSLSGVAASLLLIRYPSLAGYQGGFPILSSFLILLPTFHFYTTAIGKDGLSALALTLIMIGAIDFPARVKTLTAGFLLLILVRPHIAAVAGVAFLLSQMIGSSNKTARLAVVPMLLASPFAGYFVFQAFLGTNIFDLNQVSGFLSERSDALVTSTYVINSSDNPIVRVFGFLFFPLFFNADSALALFASLENVLLLAITVRVAASIYRGRLYREGNVRFLLILFVLLSLFMGLTNYNIGLGLRLKASMIFPVMMALLTATEMLKWRGMLERREGSMPAQGASSILALNPPTSARTGLRFP